MCRPLIAATPMLMCWRPLLPADCCLHMLLQWLDPIELHGIGQYSSDAYFMFCRGKWKEVQPTDKDLLKYQQWLHSTGGQGTGLEREPLPSDIVQAAAQQQAEPTGDTTDISENDGERAHGYSSDEPF